MSPTADRTDRLIEAIRQASEDDRLLTVQAAAIARKLRVRLSLVESTALSLGIIPPRYDRNLGTVGVEGQRRLLDSCALVVGLGGLGGCVLESLARLGLGRLLVADGDVFDESNLNRQILATVKNLGESKAAAAARRIRRVNPACRVAPYELPFQDLGEDILARADVVVDCLDSIPARRELARTCSDAGLTLIHGAIAGWGGQVAVLPPGSGLLDRVYGQLEEGVEGPLGNLGFTAAFAASFLAARAACVLLADDPPEEALWCFDMKAGYWQAVEF